MPNIIQLNTMSIQNYINIREKLRDAPSLRVIEYIAKSLKFTQGHSK